MVRKSGGGGGMQLAVVHQKPSRRGNEWQGCARVYLAGASYKIPGRDLLYCS